LAIGERESAMFRNQQVTFRAKPITRGHLTHVPV